MNTDSENRAQDFDEKYFGLYGCYPEDETYEDEDGEPLPECEIKAIKNERIQNVRKALGWR